MTLVLFDRWLYVTVFLLMFCLDAGMVLNKEKRATLADALARCQGAMSDASASTPSALIDVIPLATAQASPMLTPLKKNKGVEAIDSDEDEDTREGIVFKKRRVAAAATSQSSTEASPHEPLAIESSGESAPEGVHVPPAPELPSALQHTLKRFQERRAAEVLGERANGQTGGEGHRSGGATW